MNILSLNIDEILYRIHLTIMEPLWYLISFRWIWDPSNGGLFSSTFDRIRNALPSRREDSVAELINPTDELGFFEYLFALLFGTNGKEGLFSLIFGSFFAWIVALAVIMGLLWYLMHKRVHLLSKQEALLHDTVIVQKEKEVATDKATRWQQILDKLNEQNENSWKIAVMDADILLDEVLQEQGYAGAGVGERLKQVGPEYRSVVQYAWEGHKTRNKVAHDPKFKLSERDARLAISMYERFFSAFYTS